MQLWWEQETYKHQTFSKQCKILLFGSWLMGGGGGWLSSLSTVHNFKSTGLCVCVCLTCVCVMGLMPLLSCDRNRWMDLKSSWTEQRNSSSFWPPVATAYRRRDCTMYLNKYSDACKHMKSNCYSNKHTMQNIMLCNAIQWWLRDKCFSKLVIFTIILKGILLAKQYKLSNRHSRNNIFFSKVLNMLKMYRTFFI